jgi:hypothetical protein
LIGIGIAPIIWIPETQEITHELAPSKEPSKVPRVEVSKMLLHLPDSSKGFFFNYWISNRSDVVVKGVVQEAAFALPDHITNPIEEQQMMGATSGASIFPMPNIGKEIGPHREDAEWFTLEMPSVTREQIDLLTQGKLFLYIMIVLKYGDELSGKMNVSQTCMYYTMHLDTTFNCQTGNRVFAVDSPAPYK